MPARAQPAGSDSPDLPSRRVHLLGTVGVPILIVLAFGALYAAALINVHKQEIEEIDASLVAAMHVPGGRAM